MFLYLLSALISISPTTGLLLHMNTKIIKLGTVTKLVLVDFIEGFRKILNIQIKLRLQGFDDFCREHSQSRVSLTFSPQICKHSFVVIFLTRTHDECSSPLVNKLIDVSAYFHGHLLLDHDLQIVHNLMWDKNHEKGLNLLETTWTFVIQSQEHLIL